MQDLFGLEASFRSSSEAKHVFDKPTRHPFSSTFAAHARENACFFLRRRQSDANTTYYCCSSCMLAPSEAPKGCYDNAAPVLSTTVLLYSARDYCGPCDPMLIDTYPYRLLHVRRAYRLLYARASRLLYEYELVVLNTHCKLRYVGRTSSMYDTS